MTKLIAERPPLNLLSLVAAKMPEDAIKSEEYRRVFEWIEKAIYVMEDAEKRTVSKVKIIAILKDEKLAEEVAHDCKDKLHDERWCGTCDVRENAVYDYQQAILKKLGIEVEEDK